VRAGASKSGNILTLLFSKRALTLTLISLPVRTLKGEGGRPALPYET